MPSLTKAASRTAFALVLLLAATGTAQAQHVQEPAYQERLQRLLSDKTPVIDVPQLAKEPKVVLLDARSEAEYAVSHIAGARRVGFRDFGPDKLKGLSTTDTIVVYCSVGYRSEKITEKLLAAGFTHVKNLYGGIFEWVNTDHTVVDAAGLPTDSLHTYNKKWSRWALKGVKVY